MNLPGNSFLHEVKGKRLRLSQFCFRNTECAGSTTSFALRKVVKKLQHVLNLCLHRCRPIANRLSLTCTMRNTTALPLPGNCRSEKNGNALLRATWESQKVNLQ